MKIIKTFISLIMFALIFSGDVFTIFQDKAEGNNLVCAAPCIDNGISSLTNNNLVCAAPCIDNGVSSLTNNNLVCAVPRELKIQYDDRRQQTPAIEQSGSRTVLTGKVTQVQELPQGMYGMWEVRGTLLDTNDYAKYAERSSDIWVLRKDGNYVTLMNPQNGASATITVTAVEDNTATFVREVKSYNRRDSEQVTLTLQGDTFYGTDLIVNEIDMYGISDTTVARYRVNGRKISGESLYKPNNTIRFQF